ncbi:hypothetical protein GIB67_021023 [Kingdonia uniflora]|uniref:AT hook motif-containing protein n=1 Tax=Kingdonia uniflora TaxID=39325 RepID=A0A7J7N771_9MAGN|nr:hypothetical protein GIB67_021023 [Kingdonia uniflora]
MTEENQGTTSVVPEELPVKRKRGRPRKDANLAHLEKASPSPVPNPVKRSRPIVNTDTAPKPDNNDMVGKVVSGVLDGSFDAGYLLTVRVGDTNTVLRGVVFEPGLSVPVSGANDVAPHIKMVKRTDVPLPGGVDPSTRTPGSMKPLQIVQSNEGSHSPINHASKFSAQVLPSPSPISFASANSKVVQNFTIQLLEVQAKNYEGNSGNVNQTIQVFPETTDSHRRECQLANDKVGHSPSHSADVSPKDKVVSPKDKVVSPKDRVGFPQKNDFGRHNLLVTPQYESEKNLAPASEHLELSKTVLQESQASSIPGSTGYPEDEGSKLHLKTEPFLEMSLGSNISDEVPRTEVIGSGISAWRDEISLSKPRTDESVEVLQREAILPAEHSKDKPEFENLNGDIVLDDAAFQVQLQKTTLDPNIINNTQVDHVYQENNPGD